MAETTSELAHQEPEMIRQQIDETRSSITTKLEALEEQVVGTVQNARDTVEETIEAAKETVQETVDAVKSSVETVRSSVEDTVEAVKDTFDVKRQVRRHPWPMVGGSLLAGLAVGAVLGRMERRYTYSPASPRALPEPVDGRRYVAAPERPAESAAPERPSMFKEEIDKVKGIAIGYAMALARDWIKEAVPQLALQIDELAQSATVKLGGQPVAGPIWQRGENEPCDRDRC